MTVPVGKQSEHLETNQEPIVFRQSRFRFTGGFDFLVQKEENEETDKHNVRTSKITT